MATNAVLSEAEYLQTSFPGVDQEFHEGEIIERTASATYSIPELNLHITLTDLFDQD